MEQVSNIPSTSAALPLLPVPQEEKRSISALHRDMWRIMRALPLWSVILPAALHLPSKVFLPLMGLEGLAPAIATVVGALIGTLGYMAALVALLQFGHTGRVEAREVWATLQRHGWKLLGVYVLSMLASFSGLCMVIFPGVLVMFRLWIVMPVQIEENLSVRATLKRSSQLYLERPSFMVGFVMLVAILYWLPEWLCLAAAGEDVVLRAALGVPVTLLSGLMPLLDVLLYVEITGPKAFQAPVGVRAVQQQLGRHFPSRGRSELAMAGIISLMITAIAAGPARTHMTDIFKRHQTKRDDAAPAKTQTEQRMTPAHPEEDDTTP